MAKTQASIIVLGPSSITIDGTDAGHILEAILKNPSATTSGMSGDHGNASVAEFHIPENPTLEISLAQVDLPMYAKIMAAATLTTSGADEVLGVGRIAGFRITPVEITITPVQSAISGSRALDAWLCVPIGEVDISYDLKQQVAKITFKLLADESRSDGETFYRFGKVSLSPDSTPPTISSVSPADGATGAATSVTPVITFSEALDQGTILPQNIFLVKATSTGVEVPVTATLSYNPTTHAVTLTPGSALASSTEYDLLIGTGIKDTAGNRFAGAKYSFTTA